MVRIRNIPDTITSIDPDMWVAVDRDDDAQESGKARASVLRDFVDNGIVRVKEISSAVGIEVDSSDPEVPVVGLNQTTQESIMLANSAVQPEQLGELAYKNEVEISDLDTTGTPSSGSVLFGDGAWREVPGGGNMLSSVYDPQSIGADAFARENHTGFQPISTITGLEDELDDRYTKPEVDELLENVTPADGTVTSPKLAPLSVIASKLDIGDTSNGYSDPNFSDPSQYSVTGGPYSFSANTMSGSPGTNRLVLSQVGAEQSVFSAPQPIYPDTDYFVGAWYARNGNSGGGAQLLLNWYSTRDATGTPLRTDEFPSTNAVTSLFRTQVLKSPVGAVSCRFEFKRLSTVVANICIFSSPTLRPIINRSTSVVMSNDFNIPSDGVADAAPALNQMLALGGLQVIGKGTYRLSSSLIISTPIDLTLHPEAKIILDPGVTPGISGGGTVGTNVLLSANAAARGRTITLSNASGFQVGDWVQIGSTQSRTSNQPRNGEIKQILSMSGNVLTFSTPLYDAYPTSAAAYARKVNFVKGVKIRGGSLVGSGGDTPLGAGIDLHYIDGLSISQMRVSDTWNRGVSILSCINFDVRENFLTRMSLGSTAYAILCSDACQWGTVDSNTAVDCGKLWDQGGNTSGVGLTRFVNVVNNRAIGCIRGGISTHETCEHINILNNYVQGSGVHGIFTRSGSTTVQGNEVIDSELNGINCSNRGSTGYLRVLGNVVDGTGITENGICVYNQENTPGDRTLSFTTVEIKGNSILSRASRGILFDNRLGQFRGLQIADNIVQAPGSAGTMTAGIEITNFSGASGVSGAVVVGNTIGVQATYGINIAPAGGASIDEAVIANNNTVLVQTGIRATGTTTRSTVSGNAIRAASAGIVGYAAGQQFGNSVFIG